MYSNLVLAACIKCEKPFNASDDFPFFCPTCEKKSINTFEIRKCKRCGRLTNTLSKVKEYCCCKEGEPLPNPINTNFVTKKYVPKIYQNTNRTLPEGTCVYCGEYGYVNKDHVIPKSRGGKTCLPSCPRCNVLKANFYLADFLHNIRNNIGNCAFLSENEKIKIAFGIEKVIEMGIEN
jgi:5-methylcytosine-specific restriction endonuclease McrA